jgi:hypothetical protein
VISKGVKKMKRKTFNMRQWLRSRAGDVEIDEGLLARSRAARIGKRFFQASLLVQTLAPVLIVMGVIAVTAVSAVAQSPGGSIFGGSDQTIGNGVRELIKWARNLLFLGGVIFVIWGIANFGFEKSCMKQFLAAAGSMSFGAISALIYSFSQGQAVNLDTSLSN